MPAARGLGRRRRADRLAIVVILTLARKVLVTEQDRPTVTR
jgi:hypothetical protein